MVPYESLLQELKNALKRRKLKFTKQREAILQTLFENEGHFSPEEIYGMVKSSYPDMKIGIATVYRSLSLLEEEKLVESISFGKEGKRYEIGMKKHHDHLICTVCGEITEFCDETIEKQQERVAESFDFEMTDHSMRIYGICSKCRKHGK